MASQTCPPGAKQPGMPALALLVLPGNTARDLPAAGLRPGPSRQGPHAHHTHVINLAGADHPKPKSTAATMSDVRRIGFIAE